MVFEDIPGLVDVKEKLFRAIELEKIAHAQLFSGPEGSANLAMAIAYAAALNCGERKGSDACGQCPSCQKINKAIHPDVHFVFPVSPAKNKSGKDVVSDSFIEDWREFISKSIYSGPFEWSAEFGGENKQLNISREESRNILKKLSLKSFEGGYKVMIIWLPEFMHNAAANALLKMLEEPPEKTVFLLVTNDHERIITTILSRAQLLKIPAFTKEETAQFLIARYETQQSRAEQIASIAGGNLNHAVRLVNELEDDTHSMFQGWMRSCFSSNYRSLIEFADELSKANKILQKGILQYGLSILRESLLINSGAGDLVYEQAEKKAFVDNFAKTLSYDKLSRIYDLLNNAFYHLERNANPKITFLDTSLLITSAFRS